MLLWVSHRTEKEMNRRRDLLANLRSKVSLMASTLNMSNMENRASLLGPEIKSADAMSRTAGLDNYGVIGLQRQIMKGKLEGHSYYLFVCCLKGAQYMDLCAGMYLYLKQNKMRTLIN